MRCVLAHDVGTSGDKATLYDEEGVLVGSVFSPYATLCPRAGWVEQSPREWWRAVCETTNRLLHDRRVGPAEIVAVSFSGQMMGTTPVDKGGGPLRDAIIWADQRAAGQVAHVAERVDPRRVYAVTGHRLSASYSAAKMLWIKEEEADIYKATYKFLNAKDFLAAQLTGSFVTDRSDASGTNLYDLRGGGWCGELVDAFGIEADRLPRVCEATDVVGEVSRSAEAETGLGQGTPVVMGGGDGSSAAVGAGAIREGVAYSAIGSSSWVALATREPIYDPEMSTFSFAHLVPSMYVPCGTMQTAGISYQFARDLLAQGEKVVAAELGVAAYEVMDKEVAQSPPGASGLVFLPYLMGERSPRWDLDARGAFIGLTVEHRRSDLMRAVLEGVALNLRVILDTFRREGASIQGLRVIGGGARSAVWNQIMADVLRVPVHRLAMDVEATSMGAAVAAGVGVGLWEGFSVVDEMVRVTSVVSPREELFPLYDELYDIFNDAYLSLDKASVFRRLGASARYFREAVERGQAASGAVSGAG